MLSIAERTKSTTPPPSATWRRKPPKSTETLKKRIPFPKRIRCPRRSRRRSSSRGVSTTRINWEASKDPRLKFPRFPNLCPSSTSPKLRVRRVSYLSSYVRLSRSMYDDPLPTLNRALFDMLLTHYSLPVYQSPMQSKSTVYL